MTARRYAAALLGAGLALGAAACSGGSAGGSAAPSIRTETVRVTRTPTPLPSFTPAPATSVAALPASGTAPRGEVVRSCPYIKAGLDSEPTSGPNVADIEGDRVGVVTVLTGYTPVGCRFYFAYSYGDTRHEAVADIQPFTLGTALAARNAMIRTAEAGSSAETEQNFVPGLVGIRYKTRFFGPDGAEDWAFVFAKGRHMVVVHTQQTNASLNAQQLAAAIAAKF